jgi:hypothetical protein
MQRPAAMVGAKESNTMPIGEILWWILLAGVLVWGWGYIDQFKRK